MPPPLASPDRSSWWTAVRQASQRLPNRVRALSIMALPLLAFATNASLGTAAVGPLFTAFVLLTVFTLWAHLPVLAFDGPLPFSDLGIHVAGEIYPWREVQAIEPGDGRNLTAVLDDGRQVKLRVRGARTHEEFREIVSRHRPEIIRF